MKYFFLGLVFSGLLVSLSSAQENEPRRLELKKAFRHKQTGIILPATIDDYRIVDMTRYGNSAFDGNDISVRYVGDKTKIDVYFYNRGKILEEDKSHREITGQIEETISFIKQYEAKGQVYRDVESSNEAQVTDYGDDMTMMQLEMRYLEENRDTGKFDSAKLESCVAVTIYSNYFMKIRHSFPMPVNKKLLEEYRENRDDFLSTIRALILDTEVRPNVEEAISTFIKDPLNDEAKGTIVAYAEASKLVPISIKTEYLPYMKEDNFKGKNSLLTAYIGGNIKAQLKNMIFVSHDLEGLQQVIKTYFDLKKINATDNSPTLDAWSKLNESELKKVVEKANQKK